MADPLPVDTGNRDIRVQVAALRDRVLAELPVEQQRVDVDGVSTSLLHGGEGPPLVLLQGLIQSGGAVWFRVLSHLVKSHRVIVPDLPGLGESEPATRLDPKGVAAWLSELLSVTRAERPILVAHSAPGAFAARFAIAHPDQLRQLVLVDSAGFGRPQLGFLLAALRSARRPGPQTFERLMRRVMHDPEKLRADGGERLAAFNRYVLTRAAAPSVKDSMRRYATRSNLKTIRDAELRQIRVPIALIWGRHDRALPLSIAEATSARLGWPLQVIDGAGHLPHVEQPDAFVDALRGGIAAA